MWQFFLFFFIFSQCFRRVYIFVRWRYGFSRLAGEISLPKARGGFSLNGACFARLLSSNQTRSGKIFYLPVTVAKVYPL
jgi:hypothetical protein